jgi:hypothetical protein
MVRAGDHLDDDTDHVDDSTEDDSPLAADVVGQITGDDGAEESTSRENGGDEGLVALAQRLGTLALNGLDEDLGTVDTVDVTGVVPEEDTAERREGAHQVRLPGDGSLDLVDACGGLEGDRAMALDADALGLDIGFLRHGEGREGETLSCLVLRGSLSCLVLALPRGWKKGTKQSVLRARETETRRNEGIAGNAGETGVINMSRRAAASNTSTSTSTDGAQHRLQVGREKEIRRGGV